MIEKRGEGPLVPQWGDEPYRNPVPKSVIQKSQAQGQLGSTIEYPATATGRERWHCLGVLAGSLKLHGSEHDLPFDAEPEQPTTAEDGMWMTGMCTTCEKRTVWKKRMR